MKRRVSRWFWRRARRLVVRLGVWLEGCRTEVAQQTLPQFGNRPANLRIDLPRTIVNPEHITFGDNVWVGPNCLLLAITGYPSVSMQHPDGTPPQEEFQPRIAIGHRVVSVAGLQVGACCEIEIGDDVMIATNVNITDNFHGYSRADEPYKYQPLERVAPVKIGRGCWIGQNAVICPGVAIGEFTIIGANSVVTRSVPARSIAFGSPARVVKQWDEEAGDWRATVCEEKA